MVPKSPVGALRPLRVLVVIPTLNEAFHIEGVLAALGATPSPARVPGAEFVRYVVVDGGSSDGTVRIVERWAGRDARVQLLHNAARLQSAAINLAVEQCGAGLDILVRCDAHATYPEGFIAALLRSMRAVGADSVVVPMDSEGRSNFQRAVAWVSNSPIGTGGSAHRAGHRSGFVDHGHHAAMKLDMFRRAGGYDATMSHNEDAELDCRIRALGGRIYLDADIRLTYLPRANWRALCRQYFNYGRGRSRTMRRHPSSARLRQLLVPAHFVALLGSLAVVPFAGWIALAYPAVYATGVSATAVRIALRERALAGLLAAPVAAAMHQSWAAGFLFGLLTVRERRWCVEQPASAG